ncbi:MAG: diaminopimelate epimerase [Magnetococcales bacterium]|nr:diaminopimelate epimerase [Magnetococcales bacterium]
MPFVKMHGLGNDFVVLDHRRSPREISPRLAARLADRRLGVGCDQIVQLLPPRSGGDVEMRIYNADGSQAEMCGNAARCVGLYTSQRDQRALEVLTLETLAGAVRIWPEGWRRFAVDMGPPRFAPAEIPALLPEGSPPGANDEGRVVNLPLEIEGTLYHATLVSMGNPHCVIPVASVEAVPLERIGPLLEHHPAFPRRTNVEFIQTLDRETVRMRVWERGVGITPACGTGACAAGVAAFLLGVVGRRVTVRLDGGDLTILWSESGNVIMTGAAAESFHGVFDEDGAN